MAQLNDTRHAQQKLLFTAGALSHCAPSYKRTAEVLADNLSFFLS